MRVSFLRVRDSRKGCPYNHRTHFVGADALIARILRFTLHSVEDAKMGDH